MTQCVRVRVIFSMSLSAMLPVLHWTEMICLIYMVVQLLFQDLQMNIVMKIQNLMNVQKISKLLMFILMVFMLHPITVNRHPRHQSVQMNLEIMLDFLDY